MYKIPSEYLKNNLGRETLLKENSTAVKPVILVCSGFKLNNAGFMLRENMLTTYDGQKLGEITTDQHVFFLTS